jgi:lipopolysaccharide export system protein LptA
MRHSIRSLAAAAVLAALPGLAAAQGAEVSFGILGHDASLPVEVTADSLSVNQADGTAIFKGNVVVGQGDMRLAAGEVRVIYASGTASRIERLEATGGVTLASGTEAAESREAVYSVDGGQIVMTGDVVMTQGQNAISGQKLTLSLEAGTGVMEGRVRTILQTGGAP